MSELLTTAFTEGVFKLHDNGDIMGRVLKNADMKTNAGRMSATVILTTSDEDRSGDIVIPKGIDLSDHKRNPIALLNHNREAPIGRFEDKLGTYTVKLRGDNQLVGEVFFNQSSEFAHDVFRAVENKIFTGTSVGFMPKRVEKRSQRGNVYHQSSLVEGSILTIGDNPYAIVEAVNKSLSGGKPYGEELLAILRPFCPPKNETVTSGFDADAIAKANVVDPLPETPVVEKMYDDQNDTLLNGGGDDQMSGDPNDPHAGQESSDTEQAWLTIAIDLVQQAMAHDESALKKLGMLLKTRKKLIVGGDDGDMPDISDEEPDEDEVDFGEDDEEMVDEDDDGEDDRPTFDRPKSKKKPVFDKGYIWRDQDCDIITKTYKLLTSIVCTKCISREKLDGFVYKALAELETIAPVERGIVEKKIKTPHRVQSVVPTEQEEDLAAVIMALNESDAERERRNRERDRKMFEVFGR